MGMMRRAIAREEEEGARREQQQKMTDRFASTLVIAASVIAAVRLARESNLGANSPRIQKAVAESIGLARMILEKIVGPT
jgi:hypothetical protein